MATELPGGTTALFVADQRMPEMSGVEFLTAARKIFPDAKRTLLTAYADTDAAIRAINSVSIDHYLLKPWDPPEEHLYPVLNDLLDQWHAHFDPPFEGIRVVGHRWSPATHAAPWMPNAPTKTPSPARTPSTAPSVFQP